LGLVQLRWQSCRVTPDNQDDLGRFTEWHVPQESLRLRREEVWTAESRKLVLERIPVWPHARFDMFPVVEAGSLHLTFIKRKAERFDEVQNSAGGEAGTARVSGIPVNFGMHQYDVRCHCRSPPLESNART